MEKEILSEKILMYRAKHNITQKEFAKISKLSEQTVCNIEQKKQKPSSITVAKIMQVLEDK